MIEIIPVMFPHDEMSAEVNSFSLIRMNIFDSHIDCVINYMYILLALDNDIYIQPCGESQYNPNTFYDYSLRV